jgi:lipopolysaccharide/colanic/teichoic acid biosynthesis glycosyltransferase
MTKENHGRIECVGADFENLRRDGGAARYAAGWAKRAVDVIVSTLLLCLSLAFWPVLALLVKIGSRGPVFYKQRRVGRGGRVFVIRKFRSMIHPAEENGAIWAGERDPRVTEVGYVLRRMHLDELPQILNVLRGEMSLVGPRPERPEFVRRLSVEISHYDLRHRVKPGMTGWAQVNYPYASSVEASREKLDWDLYYVLNAGMALDIRILFLTVLAVMKWRE